MRGIKLIPLVFAPIALSVASAQAPQKTVPVHITVRDSTNHPVPGAELIVTQGLHNILLQTSADSAGDALIKLPITESGDYELTTRKIGYTRGDRYFTLTHSDTTTVAMVVGPSRVSLEAVRVTAKQVDPRYNSYVLDADDIDSANVALQNGWEVVKKLRPVMLTSKGGCRAGVQEVWVNGYWVRDFIRPNPADAQRAHMGVPISSQFSNKAVAILTEIAPEHIERIEYKDCNDTSMAAVGSRNAIFVTLKDGVDYRTGEGSFVLDIPQRGGE